MVTKLKAGYFLGEGDVIKQLQKSKTPMMFIHGDADTFVPYYMQEQLYNAANCEKEKLTVKGAIHAKSSDIGGKMYWDKIEQFVDKYIEE